MDKIHPETLRRWMRRKGCGVRAETAAASSPPRAQGAFWRDGAAGRQFSQLGWRSGVRGLLIDLVDDATSTTWAQLGEQETIWAVADALRAWIERYASARSRCTWIEEFVQTSGHMKEQLRGEETGHAVLGGCAGSWGDRGDRGQFAASQGTSGAAARHAHRTGW